MSCGVVVQAAGSVNLTLTSFSTQAATDVLYVYDGSTAFDPLLTSVSGNPSTPLTLTSNGTTLYLLFSSDGSVTSTGFTAAVSPAPLMVHKSCPGPTYVYLTTGVTTVTLPSGYPANLSCSIVLVSATTVSLAFDSFGTQAGVDVLTVYDGASAAAPVLAQLSGAVLPSSLTSSTSYMTLTFVSDGSVGSSGFVAVATQSRAVYFVVNNNAQCTVWQCDGLEGLRVFERH